MSSVRERTRPTTAPLHDADDMASIHRSLASLCRSGVPLPRALTLLDTDLRAGPMQAALRDLAADVDGGTPPAEAYERQAAVLPALYGALVRAGVAAGDLPAALDEIAVHADRRAAVAARIRRSLAMPLLSAGFVVAAGVIVLIVAGPQLAELAALDQGLHGTLDPSWTPAMLVAGGVLTLLIAIVVTALGLAWWRSPLDGCARGGLALRVPVIGRLRLYAAQAGIASTLASLLGRQIPLPEAARLTAAATPARAFAPALERLVVAADAGDALTPALRAAGIFPASYLWLVDAAEKQGRVHDALDDLAETYALLLKRSTDRAATMLGPAVEILAGAGILALAYAFLAPLMRYAGQGLPI